MVHLGGIKPHGQTVLAILWSLQGDYLNLAEEISLPKRADVIVQLPSHVRLFATLWTAALQASLSFTISWILLKLMSIESVMPSNHLSLCRPFSSCLQSFPVFSNESRVFSNESAFCIRWPKYWSFSFSISPSNEYSGLIFFRIGWFDLLIAEGTLKGLLQQHSSKASIL